MTDSQKKVIIVGAGIVGSALAYFLSNSQSSEKRQIIVVDRSLSPLVGSTAYAPGFVGQFNESEVLTRLAIDSVIEYIKVPDGFNIVGGLEVATSVEGIERLKTRCEDARNFGLPAGMITPEHAVELAPELVKSSEVGAALHFTADGTANTTNITSFYQAESRKNGVQFIEADVTQLTISNGRVKGVEIQGASLSTFSADILILATGIWAQDLCHDLDFPIPVVPVGHPYMYSNSKKPSSRKAPWVRWPEHHVYARDHGLFYGFGSYNHEPIPYKPTNGTAIGNWIEDFNATLEQACNLLSIGKNLIPEKKFNGIFSMTPDNLPLVGEVPSVNGLYMAAAVWVTHAAGTAKFITKLIEGGAVDRRMKESLDPARFRGQEWSTLEEKSLKGYNDIYKTNERN
ncbi:hypothetical protein B7463_g5862, partial [Scytalidium lignicola]